MQSKEEFTCKKSSTETYSLRFKDGNWAKFLIDSDSWSFSVQFANGSYAYNGWSPEKTRTFKKFLCSLKRDKEYLLNKLTDTTFSLEESIKKWKRFIKEDRKNEYLSKEEAKDAYFDLENILANGCANEEVFYFKIIESPVLSKMEKIHWEDAYVKDFPEEAYWFFDKLFLAFISELEKEQKEDAVL